MFSFILILLSIIFAILISEFTARLLFYKADYLEPYFIADSKLGFVIKPYSAGHDKWGFRNRVFPDHVDIVALGDSMTYGHRALSSDSWPSLLELKTNKKVYNMGVGAYGPVQYYYLLKEKAIKLKPKIIIVGLYLGNDLFDTYNIIYNLQYWRNFREYNLNCNSKQNNYDQFGLIVDINRENKMFLSIRNYFAHNSLLYRIILNSFLGEVLRWNEAIIRGRYNYKIFNLKYKAHNINTSFMLKENHHSLEINRKEIKEGLVKTLLLFDMMHQLCKINNIKFVVVVIPTKETVYSKYIDLRFEKYDLLKKYIDCELKVNNEITNHFKYNDINCIEILPSLQNKIGGQMIYTSGIDGHPNKYGNGFIAQAIAEYLKIRNLL